MIGQAARFDALGDVLRAVQDVVLERVLERGQARARGGGFFTAHAASRLSARSATLRAWSSSATKLGKRRDAVVALDHGRDRPQALDRAAVEVPDRIDHGCVMRVDDVVAAVAVAGQMDLLHPLGGHAGQIGVGIEAVVVGADVDIVDVEQDQAVGALRDLAQELPLGERRVPVADVAGDVFEQDAPAQELLHRRHPAYDVADRLLGVGKRQQVVEVLPGEAGPAQVIGDPQRLHALGQRLDLAQIVLVERVGAADRQGHAVHDHGIVGADAVEPFQRAPAVDQIVLGEDLQPVERRTGRRDLLVVRGAQAEAEAGVG